MSPLVMERSFSVQTFTLLDDRELTQKANPLSAIVFSQTSKSLQDSKP